MVTSGSSCLAVAEVQTALNYITGAGLVVDGKFGPKTSAAVQAWERNTNVPMQYRSLGYVVSDYTLGTLGINGGAAPGSSRFAPPPTACGGAAAGRGGVPAGNGVPGATAARANFEWKAPARLQVLTGSGWDTVQGRLTNAARNAGFEIQYASWETSVLSAYIYTLVYRGLSPANVTTADAINNHLTSLAEQAGFTVARDQAKVAMGQIVQTTDDGGGAPKKNDWIVYGALGLVALFIVREFVD